MKTTLDQLYETKARLIAVASTAVGIGLLMLAKWPLAIAWLDAFPLPIPLLELGAGFFGFGVLGIYFQNLDRMAGDRRNKRDLREAVQAEAPAIRDAVLDSLAFNPDTLKRVASDDMLDRVATNAIALRLGDEQLAHELYTDVRDQVINAPERWRDVKITLTLSPWMAGPARGKGSMFVATIRWEYKVKPAANTMRFACISEDSEYREMLRDPSFTSVWHFDTSGGVDPASSEVFELAAFTVDGKDRKIRRTERAGAQVYAVSLGAQVEPDQDVTVAYTYRVLAQRNSHLLYLDLPRPTKGLHVRLDYGEAGIRRMNTVDYFASSQASRVEQPRRANDAKAVNISFDGWTLPRAGVAFVWVLEEELSNLEG